MNAANETMSTAGPPQDANCAPSGGSAAANAASVGVVIHPAGPPQGAKCAPSGGSAAATAASAGAQHPSFADFRVADLSLADWGRKEIAHRRDGDARPDGDPRRIRGEQPLTGARITGSLHMTIQTAVLIETLRRWARRCAGRRCNIFSTQDHAAAAIAAAGTPVFAYKGETLDEYWEYTHRIFEWADGKARPT